MDITSARWGVDGAEAVLKLRAVRANDDFDEYWAFHLDKERHRVHRSLTPTPRCRWLADVPLGEPQPIQLVACLLLRLCKREPFWPWPLPLPVTEAPLLLTFSAV